MRTVSVGRGVTVTPLGLGGSQFGNLGRITTDEQCADAMDKAWRGGVRYFDTAPHYGLGLSERRFGRLLGE
jgi:D-threo-aldose 1-dehydrogenase